MPRLREVLDLLLVGFVGLVAIGALLLIAVTDRVCFVAQALRSPDGIPQAPHN